MDAAAIVSLSEKWVTVPSQRVCHSEVIRLDESVHIALLLLAC